MVNLLDLDTLPPLPITCIRGVARLAPDLFLVRVRTPLGSCTFLVSRGRLARLCKLSTQALARPVAASLRVDRPPA